MFAMFVNNHIQHIPVALQTLKYHVFEKFEFVLFFNTYPFWIETFILMFFGSQNRIVMGCGFCKK